MNAQLFEVGPGDVALTSDDWYTPRWLFDAAGLVFDLDVCAPVDSQFRTCPARNYLTVIEDGLAQPWSGVVWCNPPFSKPALWANRWGKHPTGLLLVPASDSRWRGKVLQDADAMTLISINANQARDDGFGRPDGSKVSYPTALILAARGDECIKALARIAARDNFVGGAYFVRA